MFFKFGSSDSKEIASSQTGSYHLLRSATRGKVSVRMLLKEFDLMNVTRIQLEMLAKYPTKAALIKMAAKQETFRVSRPVLPPPEVLLPSRP